MTQNANESLHNIIWNFCPKAKYISPQSVAISTAVAVTVFNEGELSIYGFMEDLQLHPTCLAFRSLYKREDTKVKNRDYFRKKNMARRTRRHKSAKERREKDLLRHEGGHSYKSGSFGSETFSNPPKRVPIRTRRPRARRTTTTTRTEVTRRQDDLTEDSPTTSSSNSDTDNSSDSSSATVCDICHERQPPSQRRSISKWSRINWVGCDSCDRWFHQGCTELPKNTDVSSIDFICYHCTT